MNTQDASGTETPNAVVTQCVAVFSECQAIIYLHEILHNVSLIAFQSQAEVVHFDNGIQQIEKLGHLLLVMRSQINYRLNLLRKDLETCHLVSNERLERI
jgi:hypothetical protein